ncbi:MAG: adenosylmethionine-8-amino-7-oxononanoate aminotransferase [Pirellulaceae bacterium]
MANKLSGQVTAISESGDAITDISHQQLDGLPRDERVTIECEGHATLGIHPEAHDQPEMTYIAICDPGQTLRLGLVGDSAAKFLGLKVGSQVHVKW